MGKDYLRAPNLDVEQNVTFGYNEDLKHKFPIDKYTMVPLLEAKKKQLQDSVDWNQQKKSVNTTPFQEFIDQIDPDEYEPVVDRPHP